jgi:hypothetical protein
MLIISTPPPAEAQYRRHGDCDRPGESPVPIGFGFLDREVHVEPDDPPNRPSRDQFPCRPGDRLVARDHVHAEHHTALATRTDHPVSLLDGAGDRLFAKNVLAIRHRCERERLVLIMRRRDQHRVDSRVLEDLLKARRTGDAEGLSRGRRKACVHVHDDDEECIPRCLERAGGEAVGDLPAADHADP